MSTEMSKDAVLFYTFDIIRAGDVAERGWNLYTPHYGDVFLGNFRTLAAAAKEAARLGGEHLRKIEVL